MMMVMHLVYCGYSARAVVEAFDLSPLLSAELVQFEIDVRSGAVRFAADPRTLDGPTG